LPPSGQRRLPTTCTSRPVSPSAHPLDYNADERPEPPLTLAHLCEREVCHTRRDRSATRFADRRLNLARHGRLAGLEPRVAMRRNRALELPSRPSGWTRRSPASRWGQ
jgi:hypothetical protein